MIEKLKEHKRIIVSISAIILFMHGILFTETFRGNKLDSLKASQYGAFLDGYLGVILSFISIIIIYFTFKEQRKMFEEQQKTIDQQSYSHALDKFESRFFVLLSFHRDNVQELSVNAEDARRVFVLMLREFRKILEVVSTLNRTHEKYSIDEVLNISYLVFFYGVGPNSSRVLKESLNNFTTAFINELITTIENLYKKDKREYEDGRRSYINYGGHQSRLGHYYRLLYQTVKYVDNNDLLKNHEEKAEYIKLIRAQLSNHEQALLLLNSLSIIGQKWRTENLIVKYELIKNIPNEFFDSNKEFNLKSKFPDIKFEFDEY